jgi:hypothetical protein
MNDKLIKDILPHNSMNNTLSLLTEAFANMDKGKYIEVKDHSDKVFICLSCGKLNDWFKWSCYQCEAEGERQHETI